MPVNNKHCAVACPAPDIKAAVLADRPYSHLAVTTPAMLTAPIAVMHCDSHVGPV